MVLRLKNELGGNRFIHKKLSAFFIDELLYGVEAYDLSRCLHISI